MATALVAAGAAVAPGAVLAGAAAPGGAAPRPVSATALAATGLYAVSCPSLADCWAVGEHGHPLGLSVPAIERLSGGTWSAVPAPKPTGAVAASLSGVWCASTSNCMAVGSYITPRNAVFPFAERWNGTRWSLVSVPAVGSTTSGLVAIACTGARDCWAVGFDGRGTLGEHWNGSAWSIVATPTKGAGVAPLAGVSCPRATDCWAAWSWVSSTHMQSGTLTAHWNGTAWSKVTTPTSGDSQSDLYDVSCSGGSACMSVGRGVKGILAQRWNGSAWSISLNGGPNRNSALTGVWCADASACMAVGGEDTGPNSAVTLAARWNGRGWSPLFPPNPAKWHSSRLNGVACTAAANCWAVGTSVNVSTLPGSERRIIEHWNGATWSLVG